MDYGSNNGRTYQPIITVYDNTCLLYTSHVKIAGGTYFLLILLTAVMVFAFWCMKAMIGLVVALGLIIIIERIIHSTYTLTAD